MQREDSEIQSLSLQYLSTVVLVCRRWREVGETPGFWSPPVITVRRRNESIAAEILSMEGSARTSRVGKIYGEV